MQITPVETVRPPSAVTSMDVVSMIEYGVKRTQRVARVLIGSTFPMLR